MRNRYKQIYGLSIDIPARVIDFCDDIAYETTPYNPDHTIDEYYR